MRRMIAVLILLVAGMTARPAHAQWAVVDMVNWVENYLQVVEQHLTQLKTVEHLAEFKKKYQDYKETIAALQNVRRILLDGGRGLDDRLGYSFIAEARHLNPNSATWRRDLENLLRLHYDLPDLGDLYNEVAGAYGTSRGKLVANIMRWDRERLPLLDGYHFQAAQEQAELQRRRMLEELQDTFTDLGDKSETKQLQTANALQALQARQNEALLDAMQMLVTAQQQKALQERSDQYRRLREEAARVASLRPPVSPCHTDCMAVW